MKLEVQDGQRVRNLVRKNHRYAVFLFEILQFRYMVREMSLY